MSAEYVIFQKERVVFAKLAGYLCGSLKAIKNPV